MTERPRYWTAAGMAALACIFVLLIAPSSLGQAVRTIIEDWAAATPPSPPALRAVTVDPKTTGLLVLDVQQQSCNLDRRPRCVASVPRIAALIARAAAKDLPVIYSLSSGSVTDILWQVRPLGNEPLVISNSDKFLRTDLERILAERGIRTVIVVGTAAHGAVLHTASAAALRGLQVIVPVDGMSAESLYIEQYVAWHLANAPTIGARVTLTRTDLVNF